VIGPGNLTGCGFGSGTPVGVAPPIQNTPEVLTQRPNGLPVLRERVAVFNPDDYRPDCASILAQWRKHRGRKPVSILITEGQEHRHDPLDVCIEPDILLNVGPTWRDIARLGVFTRLPEVLLDGMVHQIGFQGRFRLVSI